MQISSNTDSAAILHLIQRTPCVEALIKTLRHRGYPYVDEKTIGTRYQKCRRLYDILFQECHGYSEEKFEQLKKLLQDSGNGEAGELLAALVRGPPTPLFLGPCPLENAPNVICNQLQLRKSDISTSTRAILRIFRIARSGNAPKLEVLLRGVALKCAGFESPLTQSVRKYAASAAAANYRQVLGNVLLSKRDCSENTILHIAVEGKSLACIDVVLQFSQEAHRKGDLLDARGPFGQTPLHLAIKRKFVQITKKLIEEGSDLFLPNRLGQTPLGLIFQRLPVISTFLLDRSVTISGDILNDSLFLNVDFGILTAPIEIVTDTEESLMKLHPKPRRLNPNNDSDSCHKVVLVLESDEDEKNSLMGKISAQQGHLQTAPSTNPSKNSKDKAKSDATERIATSKRNPREMILLGQIMNCGHKCVWDILAHPVTQTFLDLKWKRMRYLLWTTYTGMRIGIYAMYIVLMYRVYFYHCPLNQKQDVDENRCGWSQWTQYLLPIILLFNISFLLHELIKAGDVKKMKNFKRYLVVDPGPYVFIRMIFLSIIVGTCITPFVDGRLNGYQYVLATLGILICAGLILEVLGNSNCNFIIYSIYIHIYGKVMLRFLTVLATFSPLLISFSLAFNIMYPQMKQFSSFFRSLLRLIIMLQGEFDFEDKMYNGGRPHDEDEISSKNTTSQLSPRDEAIIFWSGQMLFGLLGCVLTLVLIDVFLGYTVSDINELKTQAEYVRRRNQVVQMDEAERFIRMAARFMELFRINSDSFVDHFNVISTKRRRHYRTDMVVSFEELSESRQTEFRHILIEPS